MSLEKKGSQKVKVGQQTGETEKIWSVVKLFMEKNPVKLGLIFKGRGGLYLKKKIDVFMTNFPIEI